MKFEAKIDHKKVKKGDPDSVFVAISEGFSQWMEQLKDFNKLNPEEQNDFIKKFGDDMNALLLILWEFANPRTDADRDI